MKCRKEIIFLNTTEDTSKSKSKFSKMEFITKTKSVNPILWGKTM